MQANEIRVFVLDDDPDDIFLLEDTLESVVDTDYRVSSANNLDAALDYLRTENCDIVLCDYYLGASTGVDFIKSLKATGLNIPVVLLTGLSSTNVDREALSAGATDFLSKIDLSPSELDRTIRYAIANADRQRLLSAVLSNVDVALCVMERDAPTRIWNEQFRELACEEMPSDSSIQSINNLLEYLEGNDRCIKMAGRTYELQSTCLGDRRRLVSLHNISDHVKALMVKEEAEKEAQYRAQHCPTTGLPNRRGLTDVLNAMIEKGEPFHILNLDLDNFKDINDLHGHDVGDSLLSMIADRFTECLQPDQFVARMGGDEFVALAPITEKDQSSCPLARRINETLNQNFKVGERVINTGASIGVAAFPESGNTSQQLLSNADIAMYRAKGHSTTNIQYYDHELDQSIRERQRLNGQLVQAIRSQAIDVAFQPIFTVKDGQVVSFEALARWKDTSNVAIPPDTFVAMAEENGLIDDLTDVILNKACRMALKWPEHVRLAVNVSGVQVRHGDLAGAIQTALYQTGLPARRLEVELTESVLLEDFDQALRVLRGIKNLGVSLAMDDFGTGHSSLSSLISFPFDKLKIDRSLVTGADRSDPKAAVLRSCLGLAHNMDLQIVAEGVESTSEVEFLRRENYDLMQGYLLSRPLLDVDEIKQIIATGYIPDEDVRLTA